MKRKPVGLDASIHTVGIMVARMARSRLEQALCARRSAWTQPADLSSLDKSTRGSAGIGGIRAVHDAVQPATL